MNTLCDQDFALGCSNSSSQPVLSSKSLTLRLTYGHLSLYILIIHLYAPPMQIGLLRAELRDLLLAKVLTSVGNF
jgi:hypothetical protein